MTFTVLIPARLASTRLPNKPLADIAGTTHDRAGCPPNGCLACPRRTHRCSDGLHQNRRRLPCASSRSDHYAGEHLSGTDRLAEACETLQLESNDLVVNVQGDEPLMTADLVESVANCLSTDPSASMSTAAHPLNDVSELVNSNVVKVVTNHQSQALYFSRAPIPWWRDGYTTGVESFSPAGKPLRHIGIYAYRVGFLKLFPCTAAGAARTH